MDQRDRHNIGDTVAVIIILVLSLWLMHLAAENIKLQNCIYSGRRDCQPLPQPSQDQ